MSALTLRLRPRASKEIFNSPSQRAVAIPLRNVTHNRSAVHFELAGDITTTMFDGEVSARSIKGEFREGAIRGGQFREGDARTGQFREGDARATFSLMRNEPEHVSLTDEEVTFGSADVALSGTLLLLLAKRPHPAVVFLHGSGAEGRYASRFFAEYLARAQCSSPCNHSPFACIRRARSPGIFPRS
jgi:hypothetical protein